MPVDSMSALLKAIWDRNAYHVRKPKVCCPQTFTFTLSARWISIGLSRSGGPAPLP
jgi:hypothetical protein